MKLTTNQQIRVDVITKYLNGEIFAEDACQIIGVKERQFRRIVKKFRELGISSILHGNKGRIPSNKLSDGLKLRLIRLYKNKYSDFNLVHFIEKLHENESASFSYIPCYSTIRNLFLNEGLITVKKKRGTRVYKMRKRYQKEGLMVQIDGSSHRWLRFHEPFCLTAAIDDATGKLLGGIFTKEETTFGAMDVVEQVLESKGVFQMLYSDRAGIYGDNKRGGYSNMNRACQELGIVSLQASTPQGKGKVERLFGTLQDRLISEMRLYGVKSMDEANRFFKEKFIDYFNSRFARVAPDEVPAYKKLDESINLNDVFTMRYDRVIGPGHVVSFMSKKLVIENEEFGCLVKRPIEVRKYRNGEYKIFLLTGQELRYRLFDEQKRAA